jgi:hypothetical protein
MLRDKKSQEKKEDQSFKLLGTYDGSITTKELQ